MNLLSEGKTNTKIAKGEGGEYLTYILHLAPSNLSGFNTCPMASEGCKQACLNTAGRGIFDNAQQARIRKTKLYFEDRNMFFDLLARDLMTARNKGIKTGKKVVVRLNGTSDLDFSYIIACFPDIQFYDYTKIYKRLRENTLSNYHLTFSASEMNQEFTSMALQQGHNVAMVFSGTLPENYTGYKVISGENNDLRFLDPKNVIVGLTAKGKAKKDTSGFVVRNITLN
jgi:hypothetical protein